MKISVTWLKDYLEFDLPAAEVIGRLNDIGLMVESCEEKDGDLILDVATYSNRPDTLGHLGLARELAAALERPLKKKAWPLVEWGERTSDAADVQILDTDLCPRYCGLVVRGIPVGPSPEWLRRRLEAMGLKPINNVVDVTNYVLFSTSHPIHAFDLAKLQDRTVIVRKAQKGEKIRTLDGRDVDLKPDMLVIADSQKPVALAGVIGGEESAVSDATRDVFIESACFNPVSVRKTRQQLGIDTDASYRFERGADISFPPQAALMAASLLCQMGGKATAGILDVYPEPRKNREIILRHRRIAELLGVEVEEAFVEALFGRLDFPVEPKGNGVWRLKVPFHRVDIEREADIIEEIARFYGYDRIPAVMAPLKVIETPPNKERDKVRKLREVLFHQGFDEILSFSFTAAESEQAFRTGRTPVALRNPVSSKASLLRTTLLGGLLEATAWNRNRGLEGVHVFEAGNIYYRQGDEVVEKLSLAFSTSGRIGGLHWQGKVEDADFFHLKGSCEMMMVQLRCEPFFFEPADHPFFEPANSLALTFKSETIGHLGMVRKSLLEAASLKDTVYAAEIDLALLLSKQPKPFVYAPVVRFPSIVRDLSFLVGRDISYQDIRRAIDKSSLPFLEDVGLLDIYSGSSLGGDKVSLTLRFVYRHPQRTLTADEVDKLDQKIIGLLGAWFKIQMREGGKIDNRT